MGRKIRIGSRASRLAVVQSELVMAEIRKILPEADLELVTMKTTGDKILHKTLDKIGGKGLFLKELDAALLRAQPERCAGDRESGTAHWGILCAGTAGRCAGVPEGNFTLESGTAGRVCQCPKKDAVSTAVSGSSDTAGAWQCADTAGKTGQR